MLLTIIAKCVSFEVALTILFFIGDAIIRKLWKKVETPPDINN